MKMLARATLIGATLGAFAAGAQAQLRMPGDDSNFYVGGSLGASHYKGDDLGPLGTDRSGTGLKLYGGYALTPNIAFEAGYANLGKFQNGVGALKADGLYLDAVGKLPIVDRLSLLGRVGVVRGTLDSDLYGKDHGTNLKVGAGLQYDLTPNIGLRGEVERYRFDAFGTRSNTDLYSVGVNYKF